MSKRLLTIMVLLSLSTCVTVGSMILAEYVSLPNNQPEEQQ